MKAYTLCFLIIERDNVGAEERNKT